LACATPLPFDRGLPATTPGEEGRAGVATPDARLEAGFESVAGGGPRDQAEDAAEGAGEVALLLG
jgi:hypothetical protein